MTYLIRPGRASDQSYVAQSWVHALGSRYDRGNNELVNRLLDDPRTVVSVACSYTDSDRILGWIASAHIPSVRVLEYVLVRKGERGKGIGRALTDHAGFNRDDRSVVTLFMPQSTALSFPRPAVLLSPEEFLL